MIRISYLFGINYLWILHWTRVEHWLVWCSRFNLVIAYSILVAHLSLYGIWEINHHLYIFHNDWILSVHACVRDLCSINIFIISHFIHIFQILLLVPTIYLSSGKQTILAIFSNIVYQWFTWFVLNRSKIRIISVWYFLLLSDL